MRLARLSIACIVLCVGGLVGLGLFALDNWREIRAKQAEVLALSELQESIGDFSVASDSMLLLDASPDLWSAYRADARAIVERLRGLAPRHPDAAKAAHQVQQVLHHLARERETNMAEAAPEAPSARTTMMPSVGPPGVPPRARSVMHQVATHGIALDTALDDVLRERQAAIARDASRISARFAAAAAAFGALCIIAFSLIHRRISRPAAALSSAMARLRGGEPDARARIVGNDELSDVAARFNDLMDHLAGADRHIREQREELGRRAHLLAASQRIASVGSWRLHVADGSFEWSEETYRILGLDPARDTATRERFTRLVHPDDRKAFETGADAAIRGEQPLDLECRVVRPDRQVRIVDIRAEPDTVDGEAAILDGTLQDITDRRRRDERLRHYRRLIEASREPVCILDEDYRFVLTNEAYRDLYVASGEDPVGSHVTALVTPGFFHEQVKPPLDRALAGEQVVFEAARDYPGVGERELLIRYFPLGGDAERRQAGVVMTDVTEARRAEREMREQARLLDIAGRVARLGGWSVDLASGAVRWSHVVAEIHGVPADHAPGLDEAMAFYHPDDRPGIRASLEACAERGAAFDEECRIRRNDGEEAWVRAVGEPVHDRDRNIVAVQGALQDITAQKEAEAALERMTERLRNTLERITDAMFTLDREGRFDYVNGEAERLLARSADALRGRDPWSAFPAAAETPIHEACQRAMRDQVTVTLEEFFPPLQRWLDVRAYPAEDGLTVYFRDVTERREMIERSRLQESALRASRDELAEALEVRQSLIDALPAQIALVRPDGTVRDVNEEWVQYGQSGGNPDPQYGVGRNYLAVCAAAAGTEAANDAEQVAEGLRAVLDGTRSEFSHEYPCLGGGESKWFRVSIDALNVRQSGRPSGAVVMHIDITERKRAEQELNRLAYEDALTGLPSRNGFVQAVDERLRDGQWQSAATVVMMDVAHLRDINDTHGYEVGDALLTAIGKRIRARLDTTTVVARIGGDEFAVFLPGSGDDERDAGLPHLAATFDRPFQVGGQSIEVEVRLGYTRAGATPRAAEELVREAELALFHARDRRSPVGWQAYSRQLDAASRERIETTQALRRALDDDELELHYHPKVALADGRLVACEALMRWNHPTRGLQSPGRFIPIAEQSQLIVPMGEWALREACRSLREWQDAGLEIVRVAVNVSLVQFLVGDITHAVSKALRDHDVPASALTLEITESVFGRDSGTLLEQLQALSDMGVRLSLDDFGTGYSSLLYLQRYPFDEIKIDQGFVRRMLEDDYSHHIVATINQLAAAMGAETVAEGIETETIRDSLIEMGCTVGQGFYYSMPLEHEDFRWLLDKRARLPIGTPE